MWSCLTRYSGGDREVFGLCFYGPVFSNFDRCPVNFTRDSDIEITLFNMQIDFLVLTPNSNFGWFWTNFCRNLWIFKDIVIFLKGEHKNIAQTLYFHLQKGVCRYLAKRIHGKGLRKKYSKKKLPYAKVYDIIWYNLYRIISTDTFDFVFVG